MQRALSGHQGARGYTIVEMLVALAIAAIFFTSFFAVVTATLETLRTGDERTVAQQNARAAMATLMAEIRTATEIEPRSLYEPKDPVLGGLPRNPTSDNPLLNSTDAWPVLGRGTDADTDGYITLDDGQATGGVEPYAGFRTDERPYDLRPLNPNRLTVRLGNPQYYGNTRYQVVDPQSQGGSVSSWDLDDSNLSGLPGENPDNATVAETVVTYEHQIAPGRVPVYDNIPAASPASDYVLDGLVKRLYVMAGGGGSPLILDTDSVNYAAGETGDRDQLTADLVPSFYLLRSFETGQTNVFDTGVPTSLVQAPSGVGNASRRGVGLFVPPVHLRQPIADHVIDIRFRYWTEIGGTLFEVRYDPNLEHATIGGGTPPDCINNGYYRYFDQTGNEVYVWSSAISGPINVDFTSYLSDPQAYIDNYAYQAFICVNEFERGLLMFEGWRLISAVSVTLRTANDELLQEYVASILSDQTDLNMTADFGLGFTDFEGAGYDPLNLGPVTDISITNPLYRGVDSHRGGYLDPVTTTYFDPADLDSFDIPEPLTSTNFEPTRFVTLQSMIAPPALRDQAREFQNSFALAFRVFKTTIDG